MLVLAQAEANLAATRSTVSDPAERWEKYFESNQVSPATIRQLVNDLSAEKKADEVIALLEQAIIRGQGQPWMYEVLALSMEIAGRPRPEIERVLLSSQDLTPPDAESLLFVAAYLARFERFSQAIECCRMAIERDNTHPEPYATALRYARRIQDDPAVAWAAMGVLRTAWLSRDDALRHEALLAIADVRERWRKAGQLWNLAALDMSLPEVQRIDLQLRLEWSGAGDLDLEIEEPSGTLCSRTNRYTPGGGIYRHDGSGPQAARCYDEYLCPMAWAGEYRIRVIHSWGTIVGKRATLTVTRDAGTQQAVSDVIPLSISAEATEVRVTLPLGRRDKVAALPKPTAPQAGRPVRRPTILQQLQVGGTRPFNVGSTPAIGPGAVGYQPIIQFINEGVTMSTQAVISGDRRYVRITTSPVFSNITDVFTFSFIQ
ncbi:hypothetical protein GC163_08900 [bacterium]|nr:hypothetical protein [bacterium]